MNIFIDDGGGAPTDPNFANVGLLLHLDESSKPFIDFSANAHTITATSPSPSSAQSVWGGRSCLVSTSQDSSVIQTPHHTSLSATTQDFTIEMWVRFTSVAATAICFNKSVGTGVYPYQIQMALTKIYFLGFDSSPSLIYNINSTTTIVVNTWYFVQARRTGQTFALAINGTQEATTTLGGSTTLYEHASAKVSIGGYPDAAASNSVVGYIDDVRFTKGVARAFAMPSAAFPNS